MRRLRRGCLWFLALLLIAVGLFLAIHREVFTNEYWVYHQHCIKAACMDLEQYADEHDGRYPFDPRGYPYAFLQLREENYHALTAPGFSAEPLRRTKRDGGELKEDECGRVYVQGLTKKNDAQIALLFDKRATQGGDHCHPLMRWHAPLVREVLFVGAGMRTVPESEWPAFSRDQVELLVKAGIPRAEAERLYELNAK